MSAMHTESTGRLLLVLVLVAALGGCAAPNRPPSDTAGASTAAPGASSASATPPASGASAAVPLVPLTVNYAARGSGHSGAWLAHEGGFFREQGLDVTLTYIPSTPTVLQAMVAGQVQLS